MSFVSRVLGFLVMLPLALQCAAGANAAEKKANVQLPVEFDLIDHRGNAITAATLRGRPSLLFFGFTRCPDICPTSLLEIGETLDALGDDAARLNVLFVSLDPDRDTREHLATYLSVFDHRIIGVTGDSPQITRLAKDLGVVYERVEQKADYVFNHSIFTFVLDSAVRPNGRLLIGHGAPREVAVKRLKAIILEAGVESVRAGVPHTAPSQ